jgi:hypothetical protein
LDDGPPQHQNHGEVQAVRRRRNILYVSNSPRGSASYSNRVAARVIDELRQANPQSTQRGCPLANDGIGKRGFE